jgi:hypothetical protein
VGGIGIVTSSPGAYDAAHAAIRKAMLAARQPGDRCVRCGRLLPADPAKVDLGHRDDRAGYSGLECARCNRSAGGKLGNERKRERVQRAAHTAATVAEVALAVEVDTDRTRCSVVTAGYLDGDLVLLDLAAYLDGTDPVDAVLGLREQLQVVAVVVDPHSPGATSVRPLELARVTVTRPSSSDLAVAHGNFIDALRAGRVRHQRQPTLTAALQHLQARRLGGATGPERRGGPVDVAPAVAAMLACWGLETLPRPVDPFALIGT